MPGLGKQMQSPTPAKTTICGLERLIPFQRHDFVMEITGKNYFVAIFFFLGSMFLLTVEY